jgi:PAS domain S-box-containing protein
MVSAGYKTFTIRKHVSPAGRNPGAEGGIFKLSSSIIPEEQRSLHRLQFRKVRGGVATDEETRIREALREQPLGMNIKEIAAAIGMSRNSVAKYLDVLTATGQLEVRQIGNAKLYYLSRRVPVKDLLQLTHEMIVMLDGYLRVVQASDSFIAFIGCSREQVLNSRLSRLPVPVLSEKEESELSALLSGGPAWKKEIRLVKNGSPVYLSGRFVPAVFEGGNTGITVMFENITAQRQAEVALMENERFLFNILQLSPTPKFLIDKNHKVIFWNRALEIMTRLKAEDMMGTTFQWKAFYPGPRPCLADILLDGDAAGTRQQPEIESRTPRDTENTRESTEFFPSLGSGGKWLHCTATLLRDSHGNLTGAMETLEDITDKKQREFQVDSGT